VLQKIYRALIPIQYLGQNDLGDCVCQERFHLVDIQFNIVRSDPNYCEAALPHVFVAFRVIFSSMLRIVYAPVYFHHETQVFAAKIGEVWTDWTLPPKLATLETTISQLLPKYRFRFRFSGSEVPSFGVSFSRLKIHWFSFSSSLVSFLWLSP